MAAGIKILGRDVTVTIGGAEGVGVTTKGITLNNEAIDVTDDASGGWTELAATSGLKNAEVSLTGFVKNLEMVKLYFQTSNMAEIVQTYPDGSTITGDFFLNSISYNMDSNGQASFDASFASSGAVVFVAGV